MTRPFQLPLSVLDKQGSFLKKRTREEYNLRLASRFTLDFLNELQCYGDPCKQKLRVVPRQQPTRNQGPDSNTEK